MVEHATHHEAESSHTNDAFAHGDPIKEYLIVYGALLFLLLVTVGAARITIPEPWSFVVALTIAVVKAVLVILFFMHVKDASRVTWVFCTCSFIWLAIMLVLTFSDYLTRTNVGSPVQAEINPPPARVENAH